MYEEKEKKIIGNSHKNDMPINSEKTEAESIQTDVEPKEVDKSGESPHEHKHPIAAAAGQFARLNDIINLKLSNGDNAFSVSTRGVLSMTYIKPDLELEDSTIIVDQASFLEAVLVKGSQTYSKNENYENQKLDEIIYAHIKQNLNKNFESWILKEKEKQKEKPSIEHIIASPSLTSMLSDAAKIVNMISPHQQRVDLRHAIVSLLSNIDGQRAFYELNLVVEDSETFFKSLFKKVLSVIQVQLDIDSQKEEPLDFYGMFEQIQDYLKFLPEAAPQPMRTSDLYFVDDRPEEILKDDILGIADDARAIGEVVCLKEPGPPLAIGLFGDWGSGKSTFMNMLKDAIDEIASLKNKHPELPFVRDVVHVKFNAWHYTDTNLWASLTSEFFDQLRTGGYAGKPAKEYKNLVKQVAHRVIEAEGESASLAEKSVQARSDAHALAGKIRSLQRQLNTVSEDQLYNMVKELVNQDHGRDWKQLREALHAIGVKVEGDENGENTARVINMVANFPGRVITFARALAGMLRLRLGWRSYCLWILIIAAVFLFTNLFLGDPLTLKKHLGSVGNALSGFVPIILSFLQAYKVIKPLLDQGTNYANHVQKRTHELEKNLKVNQKKLAAAELRASEAEAERAKKEAEAARFRGKGPNEILDFFLHESEVTRSFEQDTGIVSRVRRAFEQLNAIIREHPEKNNRPVLRTSNADSEDSNKLPSIERIILYIDDLDRCRVRQVVQVLEAVHLLLAFPLFVVVVGVDPRWLESSLLEFYEKQLRANTPEPDSRNSTSNRASVFDYLEKIFQIPIQLRGMTYGKDGSFGQLIARVSGPVTKEKMDPERSSPTKPGGKTLGSGTGNGLTVIQPVEIQLRNHPETAQETIERVTLGQQELEMMQLLGPIAGKSPRAAKRFVNLYRIVRGLRRGKKLDLFLYGNSTSDQPDECLPIFPAVLFWLAIYIGQSFEQVERIRKAVSLMQSDREMGLGLTRPLNNTSKSSDVREVFENDPWSEKTLPDWSYLFEFWCEVPQDDRPEMCQAFNAVESRLPGVKGLDILKEAMHDTDRFTFAYR